MLNPFRRGADPHPLVVGMTGVKLGDRLAQIGCADGGRLAAVAAKVGLSGRAIAIVPDAQSASRVAKGAADAGVLVEVHTAPPTRLPVEDAGFDVTMIDETGGLLRTMGDADRLVAMREVLRILRPGGRVMVIAAGAPRGIGAWVGRPAAAAPFDPAPGLQAAGFVAVRALAEREGLLFVEGTKPRTPP